MAGRRWNWSTYSWLQRLSQYINTHSSKPTLTGWAVTHPLQLPMRTEISANSSAFPGL